MGPSYAGILGPIAFVSMILRGLISGSSAANSVFAATVCLLAFGALGYVLGQIADRIVMESVNQQFAAELKARAGSDQHPTSPRPERAER